MYAEFDAVSFKAMANKGSEPVPCDLLARPTSEPPCRSEPPVTEAEQNNQRGDVEEDNRRGGGEQASPAAVTDKYGANEEVSSDQAAEGRREGEQGGGPYDCDHDEDDEGYHTPTSPRHRIPADLTCPPAPKKALSEPRWRKRKAAGDEEFYRVVWLPPHLPLEVELLLCPIPLGSRRAENVEPSVDILVKNNGNV